MYLDYNSTTPVDKRVSEVVFQTLTDVYGNASSQHSYGIRARLLVDEARSSIAKVIGSVKDEIYFTSGATESINFALKGLALHPRNSKRHIITCPTEHKAVLETCYYLESIGFDIDYLPVNEHGVIDLEKLSSLIKQDTLLICLMWVNNETGVIHPIEKIGEIAKEAGAYFVCDGTQGVGKLPINVVESNIDILCFSGHKMYAPKGIGGLYINSYAKAQNRIQPLLHGGAQENGLRSGTYNVPLIAGLGKAFEISLVEMETNKIFIESLRNKAEQELLKLDGAFINGKRAPRIFNTVNVSILGFDTDVFIGINKDIAISNGSACNSSLIQPSHVLLAMGLSNSDAISSIRISLGKDNTNDDIDLLLMRIHDFMTLL
ncbi:IscS subfamily cysteine desulfurase [Rhabdobacter roseus]|uniref:cysteine desulfurase n=1 Tax=Rhabdobacter roseus TaxID=1655419 RepID=A0A840TP18_9BACT|nr:cysteine desulfurase family protein [Rhabdobacter roseus]MBB5282963.1 cysteine desulfurase [Rhabdobacter roseus]